MYPKDAHNEESLIFHTPYIALANIFYKKNQLNTTHSHTTIISHNDGIGNDYRFWSPSFNIHFGYWKWGVNPFDREAMLRQMNQEVLDRLAISSDQPPLILDAGCGAGATLRYMANRLPNAHFKGITLAPWLLDKGKKLNEATGLSNRIKLIKADFQNIPLPDACADAVICIESVCYAEGKGKEKLIAELRRILKPGGQFVIVDAFRKSTRPMPIFFEKLFRENAELWAVDELAELPLFENTLSKYGFENIKKEDISWRSFPTALHIPFVVFRLLLNGGWRRNDYWKALLMTLATGCLMRYFGYYIIRGRRS